MNVQFIPWLPFSNQDEGSKYNEKYNEKNDNNYSNSKGDRNKIFKKMNENRPILDFSLHKDGVSQDLARDLELKFRRLPSGASPGLLDWAELTSKLIRKLPMENQKSMQKSLLRDIKMEDIKLENNVNSDVVMVGTKEENDIEERRIQNEINTIIDENLGDIDGNAENKGEKRRGKKKCFFAFVLPISL